MLVQGVKLVLATGDAVGLGSRAGPGTDSVTASRLLEVLCTSVFPPLARDVPPQHKQMLKCEGEVRRDWLAQGLCYLGPAELPMPASAFNTYMALFCIKCFCLYWS